jgi:cell division protein FtsI (penicillin-binding protein 3)
MAAALEEGLVTEDSTAVVPDHLRVSNHTFTDHDPHPTKRYSMTDIMATSSNVGTIQLGQQLGKERIDQYLRKFGFGAKSGLDWPNESAGLMLDPDEWSGTSIGTVPIGQGVAVTAVQMLSAYNVLARHGEYIAPKLVKASIDKDGVEHPTGPSEHHPVVSAQSADAVRDMMAAVVNSDAGTGSNAAIDGYTVAGKTGTARKPQDTGTYRDAEGNFHYMAAFAGFVPAENPQLSAIVVLDEPTTSIFAAQAAAPVFSRVMSYALRLYRIPPPAVALALTPPSTDAEGANEVPGGLTATDDGSAQQGPGAVPDSTPPGSTGGKGSTSGGKTTTSTKTTTTTQPPGQSR